MKGKILFGVTALCVATAVWAFVSRAEAGPIAAPIWTIADAKCGDWTCAGTWTGKDTETGDTVQCKFFAGQATVHICYSNGTTGGWQCQGTEAPPYSQLCSGTYVTGGATRACRTYYAKCTQSVSP